MSMVDTMDLDFTFDDPKPAAKKVPGKKATPGRPTTRQSQKKEISEQLTMLITVISLPISAKDDHCGPILAENAKNIAEALAEQALNSPALMKWLDMLTAPTGWVGVGMAFWPVAQAIAEHHIIPIVAKQKAEDLLNMPQFTTVDN